MDPKKKIIYGGVAAAVVVLVVVVVVVAWPRNKTANVTDCRPLEEKPHLKWMDVNNVVTDDKKNMVNIAGYLDLGGDGYLPVQANSVVITDLKDKKVVELKGDCVKFQFDYVTVKDDKGVSTYKYSNAHMFVKNGASKKDNDTSPPQFIETCKFDMDFAFSQPSDRRYSCEAQMSHPCSALKLVLKSLEIEFEVAPDRLAKNKFSRDRWSLSCDSWWKE